MMKKYIFITFFLTISQLWSQNSQKKPNNQLKKGHLMIGLSSSNFQFQYILDSNEQGQKGKGFFSGDINAFYLVTKNLGIGAFISYRHNDFSELRYDKRYYTVIGPQLRVYFNTKNKIAPFFETGYGYIDFPKIEANGFLFNTTLGSSFFINNNVAVDAGISYIYSKVSSTSHLMYVSQTVITASNGFGFHLGFNLFL